VTYTRRKTLGITIYPESRPELRVQVRAPLEVNAATVAEIVLKRAPWILKHLRALENRPPKQPPPGYVNGTTHWYLGHPYPLQVESLVGTELAREQVKLDKTALIVWTRNPHNARRVEALVEGWYHQQAEVIFAERLALMLPRFQQFAVPMPSLKMRRMKARWGSCGTNGVITLNLKLMQAELASIDYVIVHELCHLIEHNHSKRYYALLGKMMPDWRARRQRLNGAERG
jgi:predicted metal-dependent hydrolase